MFLAHVKSSIWPQCCELSRSCGLCCLVSATSAVQPAASRGHYSLAHSHLNTALCAAVHCWAVIIKYDDTSWRGTTFLWPFRSFLDILSFSIAIYYPDGLRVQFLQFEIIFQCDRNVSMIWPFVQICCAIKTIFLIVLTDLIIQLLNKK